FWSGTAKSARACSAHRRQRTACVGEGQASPARNAGPQRRRGVRASIRGRIQPAGHRGRARRRAGVRRKTCTRLARALTTYRSKGIAIMNSQKPVRRIAIVGTGTIGASWATHYLARGFDVTATDPAPGAEARLRSYVEGAWWGVKTLGLAPGASPDRLKFTSDLAAALADADFVQENAPERPELKVRLFADIDEATPPEAIIASSSSGITMSVMQ